MTTPPEDTKNNENDKKKDDSYTVGDGLLDASSAFDSPVLAVLVGGVGVLALLLRRFRKGSPPKS